MYGDERDKNDVWWNLIAVGAIANFVVDHRECRSFREIVSRSKCNCIASDRICAALDAKNILILYHWASPNAGFRRPYRAIEIRLTSHV